MSFIWNGSITGLRHAEAEHGPAGPTIYERDIARKTTPAGEGQLRARRDQIQAVMPMTFQIGVAGRTERTKDVPKWIGGIPTDLLPALTYPNPEKGIGERLEWAYQNAGSITSFDDYVNLGVIKDVMDWSAAAWQEFTLHIGTKTDGRCFTDPNYRTDVVAGLNGGAYLAGFGLMAIGGLRSPYASAMRSIKWGYAEGWTADYVRGKVAAVTFHL
jgi:hypothetical protein